jgi:hypothetical protein
MFQPIWPSSGVQFFLLRKLLSSVVNIYAGPFDAPVCWCVVFFLQESGTRHTEKHTARKNTMYQLQHTSAWKGTAFILTTEDSSFLIKKILTPDDGHIGQNKK